MTVAWHGRTSASRSYVVIRLHPPRRNEDSSTPSRRWPFAQWHRLLRRVLTRSGDGAAQRVLIVGTGCSELTAWLESLGLEVVLFDEAARNACVAVAKFLPLAASLCAFDLVLADERELNQTNLLDFRARARTADLLSQLRPSGEFVVVSHQTARSRRRSRSTRESHSAHEQPSSGGHAAACWTRHLACFPGQLETVDIAASQSAASLWGWLFGVRAQPGGSNQPSLSIVSLRIPMEPLSPAAWQDHVRCGLLTGTACCELATLASSLQRRVA